MSLVKVMDVASYQPRDLTALIQEHQPAHVICHLYHDQESPPWDHSAAQVQSALDNGCTVGGYAFLYPGTDQVRAVNSVLDRCASIGLVLPLLWLDVEEYNGRNLTPAELRAAVNQCEALRTPVGLYTSRWMWSKLGNPPDFIALPVWAAEYDTPPTLDGLLSIPNLPNVVGHQYQGDPIDLSVMLEEYTVVAQPPPCAAQDAKLARVRAIIDARPYRAPSKRRLLAALGG